MIQLRKLSPPIDVDKSRPLITSLLVSQTATWAGGGPKKLRVCICEREREREREVLFFRTCLKAYAQESLFTTCKHVSLEGCIDRQTDRQTDRQAKTGMDVQLFSPSQGKPLEARHESFHRPRKPEDRYPQKKANPGSYQQEER